MWPSHCPHHEDNTGVPRCVVAICFCWVLQTSTAVCGTRHWTVDIQNTVVLESTCPLCFGGASFVSQPRILSDIFHDFPLSLQADFRLVSCGLSYWQNCKISHKEVLTVPKCNWITMVFFFFLLSIIKKLFIYLYSRCWTCDCTFFRLCSHLCSVSIKWLCVNPRTFCITVLTQMCVCFQNLWL